MDQFQGAKNLIDQSKNIYIWPEPKQEESIIAALALFYTLKELNKNVNLVIDEVPERLRFLIPSLNYVSYPRNFVITLPNNLAEVSQIRYEKDERDLKINLTIDKGNIKKNDISFCYAEPKAEVLITLGLAEPPPKDKSIFSDAAVININNQEKNNNFGGVNLVKQSYPLAQLLINLIKSINENLIKDNVATALLAGIIVFSDNFKNNQTSPEIFETAAILIKNGASHQKIMQNLYKQI